MKKQIVNLKVLLDDHGIAHEDIDENSVLAVVPGERKLQTNVIFKVSDKTLSINAFVMRKPDQNIEIVHEWL